MASPIRRNHYIPRFYLRNFTESPGDENSKFDLYNIKSQKLLTQIPYKEQMREKYFYEKGSDLDHRLSVDFEGLHSSVLSNLLEGKGAESKQLLEVILLMHFRTKLQRDDDLFSRKFMIDENIDYLESSFKKYLTNKGIKCKDLDLKDMVKINSYEAYLNKANSAEQNIENFKKVNEEISGLSTCVMRNTTGTNFVSSDRPVIHVNPYLANKVKNFGIDGLYQLGVFLILPINPEYLIVAYDASTYEDPLKYVLTDIDVIELNKRHVMQADIGVYSTNLKSDFKLFVDKSLKNPIMHAMVKVSLPENHFMYYKEEGFPKMNLGVIKVLDEVNSRKLIIPFPREGLLQKV